MMDIKKSICLIALSLTEQVWAFASETSAMTESLEAELNWLQAESVVYSAARAEQQVLDTPAAVFVISQQDIKRSGITSIPEALRTVPGIEVAQLNANVWAITSRGFNTSSANKLLVMIDGRTVYHPVFSGTLWRTKDVLLEDVERIEVIRGPGATLWGSNAVNGVINVITKKANATQGLLVTGGGGSEEKVFSAIRYGDKVSEHINYRAYVKYANRDNFKSNKGDGNDAWDSVQGGFRLDADLSSQDQITLQGDIYDGNAGNFRLVTSPTSPNESMANIDENFSGGNILGRWTHTISQTSAYTLQFYYDHTDDDTTFSSINENLRSIVRTFDVDFQHNFQLQPWLNITWGLGTRYVSSTIDNAVNFSFLPNNRDTYLYSAFIQNELILLPETLKIFLGSKFEHNDFSGYEFQPSARLVFTPDETQTFWASVSRAVRIPNRLDHDLHSLYIAQVAPGFFARGEGNSHFDSEQLIAYELGYRIKPTEAVSIDLTAFYNNYDKLTTAENGDLFFATTPSPHAISPIFPDNKATGETYGVEVLAQWQVQDWWRLQGGYSYLQIQLHTSENSTSIDLDDQEGDSPHHQFSIRSSVDVMDNVFLDSTIRYVDNLPNQDVKAYTELDIRLAWTPVKDLELSVVGQNLLDNSHAEYGDSFFSSTLEVQRSVYGKFSWQY